MKLRRSAIFYVLWALAAAPGCASRPDAPALMASSAQVNTHSFYYEQPAPDGWLLESDDFYTTRSGGQSSQVREIVYHDANQRLMYPYAIDALSLHAQIIAAEKAHICAAPVLVIALQRQNGKKHPPRVYERIVLNLQKERQAVQMDDDYSTWQLGGLAPLAEFLQNTPFSCAHGFMVVRHNKLNEHLEPGE